MGREEARKHAASRGGFVRLKADKEKTRFVPLTDTECVEVEGFKKGTTTTKYRVKVAPVPVTGGNMLNLDLGAKAFAAYDVAVPQGSEGKKIVEMQRHGKPKDTSTFYTFKIVGNVTKKDKATVAELAKQAEVATPF